MGITEGMGLFEWGVLVLLGAQIYFLITVGAALEQVALTKKATLENMQRTLGEKLDELDQTLTHILMKLPNTGSDDLYD